MSIMSSNLKRTRYVSENDPSTSEDEAYFESDGRKELLTENPKRKPKCFTKNALMARENRLKKKLYVNGLENELKTLKKVNKKCGTIIDNQSFLIADLKKEIKYLRSIIANSSDISRLIKNINNSTGMSVSSSLDESLSLNAKCVSKRKVPIARKTAHPWDENKTYPSYPTPESLPFNSPESSFEDFDLPSNNCDLNEGLTEDLGFNGLLFENEAALSISDHDYSSPADAFHTEVEDDVGVCLHVSKNKVSLEFCATCNENSRS